MGSRSQQLPIYDLYKSQTRISIKTEGESFSSFPSSSGLSLHDWVSHQRPTQSIPEQQPSNNRIFWKKIATPLGLLLAACILSTTHHLYYKYLSFQTAGSTDRQQWSIRIGTALATTIVILLKCAVGFAYIQLLWLVLRKRAYRIVDLDALFALGFGNLTALFTKGIWTTALIAVPIAVISIIMPLVAIFPPATLSVGLQQYGVSEYLNIPQYNWNSSAWWCGITCISEPILSVALQTSQGGKILDLYKPAANSTYRMEFKGPSLSCEAPNITQQAVFDFYLNRTREETGTGILNETNTNWLYWSAFVAPALQGVTTQGILSIELGPTYWTNDSPPRVSPEIKDVMTEQLWIQTIDRRLVCTLMVANFDINIVLEQGSQTVTYNSIDFIGTHMASKAIYELAYDEIFYSFASTLTGNLTFTPSRGITHYDSVILLSNVAACPELNWTTILDQIPPDPSQTTKPESEADGIPPSALPSPTSSCRNQTLPRAVEDLFNNITVSLLSSQELTMDAPNLVTILTDQIIYIYRPLGLVASYAVSIGISIFAILLGLLAARSNGIIHVSTFSALVRATRNPELDVLFAHENIAGYPLSPHLVEKRLRFGYLAPQNGGSVSREQEKNKQTKIAFATETKLVADQR